MFPTVIFSSWHIRNGIGDKRCFVGFLLWLLKKIYIQKIFGGSGARGFRVDSRLAFIFGTSPRIDESWLESRVGERLTNTLSLLSDKAIPGNDGRIMSSERAMIAFTLFHALVCQGVRKT